MSNSDNFFSGLVGRAFNEAVNSTQKDNNPAYVRLVLALTGIMFFVGAEAVKVFFRKNFGLKGINMFQLVICFLCFLIIGIVCIMQFLDPAKIKLNAGIGASDISYVVVGVSYITLAFYLLRKGVLERMKAMKTQNNTDFKGDSDVLKILEDKGWSQNKVRYVAEPLYTLILGVLLCFFNLAGGIPFIFCALSVWGHAIMEFMFLNNPFQPDIAMPKQAQQPQQPQQQPGQPFKSNRVDTDF